MTEERAARASLEIGLPEELVRRHFFDVDYAIAKQIYHGIQLSAVGPAVAVEGSATRRIRREMRILDHSWTDDVELSRGTDGAWVLTFVEGGNAGGRFVARFVAAKGATSTRVEIDAHAPKGGFSFGFGKLSPLGLERLLEKMLKDHQRAIEGYDPQASARAVSKVVAALGDLTKLAKRKNEREQKSLVALILEVAGAVAIVDGTADDEERAILDEVVHALSDITLDAEGKARLVRSAEGAVAKDGLERRCERLGNRLKTLGCAELGLAVAALVAEASHGIDPPELAALQKIASGASVAEPALTAIIARVHEEMKAVSKPAFPTGAPHFAKSERALVVELPAASPPPRKPPPPPPPKAAGKRPTEK